MLSNALCEVEACATLDIESTDPLVHILKLNYPHILLLFSQELLQEKNFQEHCSKFENTPMHIVGVFLADLFQKMKLSNDSLKRRSSVELSPQETCILHSCPGYSQSQIIRLIIHIYGGVPEFFEILRCQNNTTKEEVQLFLNPMRATKQPFQYLILEVNRLAYHIQEVTIELYK